MGMDPSGYEDGARRIDRANKKMADSTRKVGREVDKIEKQTLGGRLKSGAGSFFGRLGLSPGQLGAAGLGVGAALGVTRLVGSMKALNTEADRFQKLSLRFGTSTEFLSEMAFAAGQSGVTFGELEKGVEQLGIRLEELRTKGSGPIIDALPLLDQGLQNAIKGGGTLEEIFVGLGDAMQRVDRQQRAFIADRLLGQPALVQLLGGRRLGATVTTNQSNVAAEANDAVAEAGVAFSRLTRIVNEKLAPAFTGLARVATSVLGGGGAFEPDLTTSEGIFSRIERLQGIAGGEGGNVARRRARSDAQAEIPRLLALEERIREQAINAPLIAASPSGDGSIRPRRPQPFLGPGGGPGSPFNPGAGGPFDFLPRGDVGRLGDLTGEFDSLRDSISEADLRAASFGETLSFGLESAIVQAQEFDEALKQIGFSLARFFFQETAGAFASQLAGGLFGATVGRLPIFPGSSEQSGFRRSGRQQTANIARAFGG
jgi:hypothetical protein